MAKITRDNFTVAGTLLTRSTNARGATPNGNVYFDTANDIIQLIDISELATTSAEANGLNVTDKMQALALYFFLLQEVDADPALQNFKDMMDAVPNRMGKLVGATSFLNAVKLATGDELKLADSGFTEFGIGGDGATAVEAIFHGAKSLNTINATSQPFYQLVSKPVTEAKRQAVAPVDFAKTGSINEVIPTFGDANNGNFDSLAYELIIGVREFGYTMAETTSTLTGVSELGAYGQGYGIGNSVVSDLSGISLADVYGVAAIAPYTGLSFTRQAIPSTETGFNEADGVFTDYTGNTGTASLVQIRAWLDAIMNVDSDIDSGTGTFIPKRAEPLYTIDSTGKLVTRSGLYIANITASDQQSVILTADDGAAKTYPFAVGINIKLSGAWFNDSGQFFRLMFVSGTVAADDEFDTAGAIVVNDNGAVAVAGDKTDARISTVDSDGNYTLSIAYDYDGNTQTGSAGTDQAVALRVGGASSSKSKLVLFTIEKLASINIDATTASETN